MKETVTSPPSNTRHPKENSGVGKQFFPRGQEDSFFKTNGIQAKLNIGQRGDKYEQHADSMADKIVSKSAKNTSVIQAKPADSDSEEKIDKKEEEQKKEEGTLQRKPMFESDGEPDVQRSMYPENDEGEQVFRSENETSTGNMSKGETIVAIARSKLGKVKAKEGLASEGGKQLRFGHETLLEIFHLAAPGVWEDDVIKYVTPGLPSWCGIFAVYCIKKAGIDIGTWQMGKGVSAFGKLKQTETPQAGDIGYMDDHQHHAIVVKVEGDMVHSIDGNSGLQSEIIENKRSLKAYRGFFTALHNEASTGDVQKKEKSGSSHEASPSIENKINSSKGGGNPLDNSTRSEMEGGFDNDFSGVRVHTGNEAQQMNKDLNAQAFTHGQDIYFDEGKYNPETSSGKHLLAHELTHTVQQTGGVQKMIQKNGDKKDTSKQNRKTGIEDPAGSGNIYFSKLKIPEFKAKQSAYSGKQTLNKKKRITEFGQHQTAWKNNIWEEQLQQKVNVSIDVAKPILTQKIQKGNKTEAVPDIPYAFTLFKNHNAPRRIIGKIEDVIKILNSPTWDREGDFRSFNVDHVHELQLCGADDFSNMMLLDFKKNQLIGFRIRKNIMDSLKAFQQSINEPTGNKDIENLVAGNNIYFDAVEPEKYAEVEEKHYWTKDQILSAEHFKVKKFESSIEVEDLSKLGDKDKMMIFPEQSGWIGKRFRNTEKVYADEKAWLAPWEITKKSVKTEEKEDVITKLYIKLNEKGVTGKSRIKYVEQAEKPIDVTRFNGAKFAGYIDKNFYKNEALHLKGASPITIDEIYIENGITAKGTINPTLGIVEGILIDFRVMDGEAEIFKTFTAPEIKVPPPFKINGAYLTLGAGTQGIFVEGDVDFEIANVGNGKISGKGKSNGNFGISGHFDFDKKVFSGGASIDIAYDNEKNWTIGGKLGLQKKYGIKKGSVEVTYAGGKLAASGSAELDIKGIKELIIKSEITANSFTIEGDAKLGTLPGVKSGNVHAKLTKISGSDYDLEASGNANLDTDKIKGLKKTEVTITYRKGGFDIGGTLEFEYDKLIGSVTVNVSNLIDGEGKPTEKAQENFVISGTGKATLKLSEKLKVTVTVILLPSGEMELKGKVEYDKEIVLFPSPFKKWKKSLLDYKIPPLTLFGLPHLADVVLTAGVDLGVHADISDGVLSGLYGEITYSPGHPEKTKAEVGGSFGMTAEAGIYLSVHGGLGLRILVATLSGNIAITADATLPLKIGADAKVKWSPQTGFEVDAKIFANITPKFTLRLGAYAELDVDYFVGSTSVRWPSSGEYVLANQTWLLNSLTIGAELPIKYKEKDGFNLDTKDLVLTYPKSIDTDKLIDDFVKPLKDKML